MAKVILLLNPVYVTLFWALVLTFENRRQQVPKLFLGRFMFIAFILYLSHYFYFTGKYDIYYHLDSIYTLASLLVYPLYHIYVRLLTVDRWFSVRKHGKYLVPSVLVFVLHLSGFVLMERAEATVYLKGILSGEVSGTGITGYMETIYMLYRIVFVIQVLFFLIANFRLIFRHNKRIGHYYSDIENRQLNWVQFFNISLAVISLASIAVAVAGRYTFAESNLLLAIPSLVFSIMLFVIGFLGNIQGDVNPKTETAEAETGDMTGYDETETDEWGKAGAGDPAIAGNRYETLKKRMELLFEQDMIYRNPDLKIWDVSSMLGTNRTYVSKLINAEYGRNFCNHVNYYRVKYAKKIMLANNKLSNEEIADLSGFGSVNSLYRAFRLFDKRTLGDYRKDPGN